MPRIAQMLGQTGRDLGIRTGVGNENVLKAHLRRNPVRAVLVSLFYWLCLGTEFKWNR